MSAVVTAVTAVTAAAFVLLAIGAVGDWLRYRDRRRGYLALALASLAVVPAGAQLMRILALRGVAAEIESALTIVAFLACGYCVLLFRHSFIPVARPWLIAAGVGTVAVIGLGIGFLLPGQAPAGVVRTVSLVVVLWWAALMGEPIARFAIAGRHLPRVQRQRMRAVAIGFAVLIAILLVSLVSGPSVPPGVQLATQLVSLAMVPVFWVSLAPPDWLRRLWRAPEEDALRRAIRDLLIFSPGRIALAEKAVLWAARLVGGEGAAILEPSGIPLASAGIDEATLEALRVQLEVPESGEIRTLPAGRAVVVAPLPLEDGPGLLAVLGGPYTPLFGSDEMLQVVAYSTMVAAGLERARVTERLAAMERTKTQFLNLASHELRGPLTVIRGYISMLEQGTFGEIDASGRNALAMMAVKATEMNSLVEQMLEAARLEEGRLELHLAQHDLRDVVSQSVDMLRPLVDETHPIRIDIPQRPVKVEIDAERIQTIVTNLVDNAVKYSPRGGEVTVEVASEATGPAVRVHDHGVGIDSEHLATLFTRFGRIATPATSHLPGTGLGLYLSRELARLHGGDIFVESRPGAGSTFTLRLPAHA